MKYRWDSFEDEPTSIGKRVLDRVTVSSGYSLGEVPQEDTDLEHHGVLGMHWGIRRTPEQLGHKPKQKVRYKIVRKQTPFEKKMAKLDAQEAKIAEKEAIKARKDELAARKDALNNGEEKRRLKAEKEEAEQRDKEQKQKEKEQKRAKEEKETKTTELKTTDVKNLSDDDLRQILNRYDMEKKYKNMLNEQNQTSKSWVQGMLTKVGQELAQEYTKKALKAVIDKGIGAANEKTKKKNQNSSGSNSGSNNSGSGSS